MFLGKTILSRANKAVFSFCSDDLNEIWVKQMPIGFGWWCPLRRAAEGGHVGNHKGCTGGFPFVGHDGTQEGFEKACRKWLRQHTALNRRLGMD